MARRKNPWWKCLIHSSFCGYAPNMEKFENMENSEMEQKAKSLEEKIKNLENFSNFMTGSGYYALLSAVILVPAGTNFWAYKNPLKNLYYLNIFIAVLLIGFAGYILYQYQTMKSIIEEGVDMFATFLGMDEQSKKMTLNLALSDFHSEIGNRCIALIVISVLIAVFTLYWNISKLRTTPSV